MNFPIPTDEVQRLAALNRYQILDTPADEGFDRLTLWAKTYLNVPIALISLIDEDRQWFKSCQGLSVVETPRSMVFCTHTIMQSEIMVVLDTEVDPRFADNPLVTGEPNIRFYAGAPLIRHHANYRMNS